METEIIKIEAGQADRQTAETAKRLQYAGKVIRQGGLVAFPTETVYGLGGDALNPQSAKKIYAAKGRPSDNPLIVHIAEMAALDKIVENVPEYAKRLAAAFWPGPLTIILKKLDIVPKQTTGGLETVAVRMPNHPLALELIREAGGYIAAPSANLSGKPSPTAAKYVMQDMLGRIDVIIAADGTAIGLESTIVDLTGKVPIILRPGYITQEMIASVVGETDMDSTIFHNQSNKAPKAPGMKYRHYAPKGQLVIVEGTPEHVINYINSQIQQHHQKGEKTGVIATEKWAAHYNADSIKNAGSKEEPQTAARKLYTFLREFDDENIEYMYAESFGDTGLGQACMNRLLKAAGHKVVKV